MSDLTEPRLQLFFWLTLALLVLYTFPLFSAPISYSLSDGFAQSHFLFYTFMPFLGERHGLLVNLTRLLTPLVAAFAAVAFSGPRNLRRTLVLVVLLVVALALGLLDISLLTETRNLASLNAHEITQQPITADQVYLTLERYQEVLLALIATILGLTLVAPSQGGNQ
jgi:hypothetical protein